MGERAGYETFVPNF